MSTSIVLPVVRPTPVRRSPRWLRYPAAGAPLVLICGGMVGAALQPGHFSQIHSTISDLAATNAHHRWLMSTALALTGAALLLLALGWRTSSTIARLLLAVAGASALVLVLAPLPGDAMVHSKAALVCFLCLTGWPAAGCRLGPTRLGRAIWATAATAVNVLMLAWLELAPWFAIGLAERSLSTVALLWIAVQAFADTAGSAS